MSFNKSFATKGITTSIGAIAAILLVSSVASQAFAANPYLAGYTDQSYSKGTSWSGRNDFSGTTTTFPRDGWLAAVSSTGTFASASATNPTGWIHQQGTILASSSNTVQAQYNVFNLNTCVHSASSTSGCSGTPPSLGVYGTSSGHINFVYTLTSIDSNTVNYYWEPTTNGGTVTMLYLEYPKSDDSDPSNQFGQGTKSVSFSGTTYKFKFYQFGAESSVEVSQTWQVRQYANTFGTTIIGSEPAKTVQYTGATNGSYISYLGTTRLRVGAENYDVGHANAPTAGTVDWTHGTMTPGGTVLWN